MFSEVVELCREMVAIPSVNPQDMQKTEPPYGESGMAEFDIPLVKNRSLRYPHR